MIVCYYGYKIEEKANKGLFVKEDHNGWLYVVDDPLNRSFFCISDIEETFKVTLTLRKVNNIIKLKRN